jgi:TolB-like protein/DNA-binding winged helix-turn-helix (wHTH) protein
LLKGKPDAGFSEKLDAILQARRGPLVAAVFEFADFKLDCSRFELLRDGGSIRLERKPMELLVLLVSSEGRLVTRAEIAKRLWDSEVFVDTEHGINTAIRKIRTVLRDDPESPRFIQTVTGMGYRFVAAVTVPVRGLSTAEETGMLEEHASGAKAPVESADLIPGINHGPTAPKPEINPGPTALMPEMNPRPIARTAPHGLQRGVWLALLSGGLVIVALLVAFGPHPLAARLLHRDAEPRFVSLAVIPLDNLSGDSSQEYFADGMTDELITMLAKDTTLRITSRTSVMQYKGAHRPLQEIARALNVDAIIEGSVSRANNQVHLTLQLIRADTDAHLWAERYDRDANDAALLDEAAEAIAKRLHSVAPSPATVRYVNPAAHDAYLRGRYLWFTRVEESAAYFRKATEIQPDYAAAWAGLANYYGVEIARGDLDPRTSMAREEEAAERAVQLDPNLAEAHQAMGGALFLDRWDFAGADRELLRAISLDPRGADLYYLRANLLQATNRFTESIEVEKKAMDLDPFSRPFGMAWIYLGARQYDEALADLRLRMEATPNSPDLLWTVMDITRRKGNTKEEVEAAAKFYLAIGQAQAAAKLRLAYERGGARGYILWLLADKLAWAKSHYVSPTALALIHARLGEKEQTLALLEEGFRQHSTDILWMQTDPAYDFLHGEPRYRSIVQRIGQPPLY